MSKKGRDYVVAVELKFYTVEQAAEFVAEKTPAGERIAFDLEDPEIPLMFGTSGGLVSEIDYPGRMPGIGEVIQKELDAVVKVGADFRLKLKWEKS